MFVCHFHAHIYEISVSNALKPQRRTSITGLTPATQYVVKLEAHNIAGSFSEEFAFMTLTKDGGTLHTVLLKCFRPQITRFLSDIPPPNLMKQGSDGTPFYADVRVIVPLIVIILILLGSGATAVVCLRHRKLF